MLTFTLTLTRSVLVSPSCWCPASRASFSSCVPSVVVIEEHHWSSILGAPRKARVQGPLGHWSKDRTILQDETWFGVSDLPRTWTPGMDSLVPGLHDTL